MMVYGWQPIETARPAIIENLLLWNGRRVFVGWHSEEGWIDSTLQDEDIENPQPTHWMPLPAPPDDAIMASK